MSKYDVVFLQMKYQISSKEEMDKIAIDFINGLGSNKQTATVVGLYGNLGAGKTTFTQAVAKSLGIDETVVSPTFVIEKIYELTNQKFSHLIHIDAYRLESSSELVSIGWNEIISNPENLILIEWPERVSDVMPEHVKIQINHLDNENSREIVIDLE